MSEREALDTLQMADALLVRAKTLSNLTGAKQFIDSARGKLELAAYYLRGVVGEKRGSG